MSDSMREWGEMTDEAIAARKQRTREATQAASRLLEEPLNNLPCEVDSVTDSATDSATDSRDPFVGALKDIQEAIDGNYAKITKDMTAVEYKGRVGICFGLEIALAIVQHHQRAHQHRGPQTP